MTGAAIAGSAVIGAIGGRSARRAAERQQAAMMAQQERYNQLRDPFTMGGHRQQYVGQLNAMAQGGPSAMADDPMFKWLQTQGAQQVQRQHSAQGDVQSTAETRDLTSMAMGQANSYWKQQMDMLGNLSGAYQPSAQAGNMMSPGDMYEMGMGQTGEQAGLWQAGIGLAGMYGRGSSGTSETSYAPRPPDGYSGYGSTNPDDYVDSTGNGNFAG